MSGGVDSSVAACLLKEQGHDVTGLFMRMGNLSDIGSPGEARSRSCCSLVDAHDAERVAASLDIPFYVLNFRDAFEELIDYFCTEYARGRTPNPCIICNQDLKFGKLLKFAGDIGASHLATGHYVRLTRAGGRHALKKARDRRKDQSYVLFSLTQGQLSRALFPLGELTKDEVRKKAVELGLRTQAKPDSQEICFVPEGGHGEFLRRRINNDMVSGFIKDTQGRVLGSHPGIEFFTIGQRRGLGVAMGEPYYVVDIDPVDRTVTIGSHEETLVQEFIVKGPNWVAIEGPGGKAVKADVRIRYNHKPAPATIYPMEHENCEVLRVVFDEPERAVTPGQATVFYDGDLVLGGGWIEGSTPLKESRLESARCLT